MAASVPVGFRWAHCPLPAPSCDASAYRPTPDTSQITQQMRKDLDEQFRRLDLPTVQPDSFNHLSPGDLYQADKPYKCQLPKDCFPGLEMHNLRSTPYPVSIADVTGHEALFSLPVSGFEFVRCPVAVQSWSDECVSSEYLPGLVQWLKRRLGCREVYCYAYNVRPRSRGRWS